MVMGLARSYAQPVLSGKRNQFCAGSDSTVAEVMVGSSRIPLRFIQATLADAGSPTFKAASQRAAVRASERRLRSLADVAKKARPIGVIELW